MFGGLTQALFFHWLIFDKHIRIITATSKFYIKRRTIISAPGVCLCIHRSLHVFRYIDVYLFVFTWILECRCIYFHIYINVYYRFILHFYMYNYVWIYKYLHIHACEHCIYNMYMAFASTSMSKQFIYIYIHIVCSILRFAYPCNSIWRWLKIKCPCFSSKFRGSKSRHLLLKDIHLHFLFVSILSSS